MHMGESNLAPPSPQQKIGILQSLIVTADNIRRIINEQKLADENLKRAKAGQPMISTSPTAPVANNKLLLWGGLGLGAFLLLAKKRRR